MVESGTSLRISILLAPLLRLSSFRAISGTAKRIYNPTIISAEDTIAVTVWEEKKRTLFAYTSAFVQGVVKIALRNPSIL